MKKVFTIFLKSTLKHMNLSKISNGLQLTAVLDIHTTFLKKKKKLIQHLQALFQNKEAPHRTLLFSSPHEEELDFIFELLQEKQGPFFCVPHQIEDLNFFLKRIEKHPHLQWISLGDLSHPPLTKSTFVLCPIFGWLAEFYRFFEGAFVGGGFDGQIHNVIEPFVLGLKVFTGPQIQKAPEAFELKKKGFLLAEEKEPLKKLLIEFLNSSSSNKEPPADRLKEWSQSIPPQILEKTFQNVSFKG